MFNKNVIAGLGFGSRLHSEGIWLVTLLCKANSFGEQCKVARIAGNQTTLSASMSGGRPALCAGGFEPQARRCNDFLERGCPQPQRVATIRPLKVRASGSNFECCGWGHPRSVSGSSRRGRKRWPGCFLPLRRSAGERFLRSREREKVAQPDEGCGEQDKSCGRGEVGLLAFSLQPLAFSL